MSLFSKTSAAAGLATLLALAMPAGFAQAQSLDSAQAQAQELVSRQGAGTESVRNRSGRTAITEYFGGGYMTFNRQCAASGWGGTHQIMVRMQPQGMPGNPRAESQMALYFTTGTIAIRYNHATERMNSGARITQATYVWNGPFVPQRPIMTISYRSRYGDYIPRGGPNLSSVFLTFANFNETRGCTATARISMGRNG